MTLWTKLLAPYVPPMVFDPPTKMLNGEEIGVYDGRNEECDDSDVSNEPGWEN